MLRTIGLILLGMLLSVLLLQGRTQAQSPVNLQADLFNLRAEVSQLRSEVAQLRGQSGYGVTRPVPTAPTRSRSPELSDRQIVDRLATLAIEAKERLRALENRVTQLENRLR